MKKMIAPLVLGIFYYVSAYALSPADPVSQKLDNIKKIFFRENSTKEKNPPTGTPIRFAKIKARITRHTYKNDSVVPGFIEKDICFLSSNQVPIYDGRTQPNHLADPLVLDCRDEDNKRDLQIASVGGLTNLLIVDSVVDIKFFMAGITPKASELGILPAFTSAASKDLNFRNMVLAPTPSWSDQSALPQVYYSAMIDLED